MRQRGVLAVVVLLGLQTAAQARPRAGFANLTRDATAGRAAIDAARTQVVAAGYDLVAPGSLRDALEGPVAPASRDPEAAIDSALGLLAEAIDAYTDFRYPEVLERLREVDSLLTRALPNRDAVQTLAEVNLLVGLVLAGQEKPEQAVESFRVVCRLQHERTELDPGRYPPQVVELFRLARQRESEAARVTLRIDTAPAGARIWVDGRALGQSPDQAASVAPGIHYVAAEEEASKPLGRKVSVDERPETRIELRLEPLAAAERVLRTRRRVIATPTAETAWTRVAETLASSVMIDVLILVRDREDGSFEAALFDARKVRLGAWIALSSPAFAQALQPRAAGGLATARQVGPRPKKPRPWYRAWWGASLLVGGGVLVAGALAYAVTSRGDQTDYVIKEWCFEDQPCR